MTKGIMIQWSKEGYRTSRTSILFGLDCHFVWYGNNKGKLNQAVRYIVSILTTLKIILSAQPKLVVMTNLPVFAPMCVLLLRPFLKFELVLDFHSGAFEDPFWRKFTPVYKYICKTAPFTIAHNDFDGEILKEFGGNPIYMKSIPKEHPKELLQPAPTQTTIIVICSFTGDEPIHLMLDAMKLCPKIEFQITGNFKKVGLEQDTVPENVTLLGFLSYEDYTNAMAKSTAVMTVSIRDKIMQAAVHEALSVKVPVIANKSKTLEEALGDAGVFADVEPESIANACEFVATHAESLREKIILQSERKLQEIELIASSVRDKYPDLF